MQMPNPKTVLNSGMLELGGLVLALVSYGHCNGIHAETRPDVHEVIRQGRNSQLATALHNGADPKGRDGEGTPALMNAVLYGDADMVGMLLRHGADPNATNAAGATALLWAAGDPQKASLLLKHGAFVNTRSALGRSPLQVAATQDGGAPVVGWLVERGADLTARDNLKGAPLVYSGGGGAPPIVEAAKARDGSALHILLEQGVDVNDHDGNGGTALTEATVQGNLDNVHALLKAGADVEATVSSVRYTPLMLAAIRNNFAMVKLLLKAGSDVNAVDANGTSVLMWAAYSSETGDPRIVDLLVKAGADVSARNRRQETALTLAKWHGATPMVAYLEQAGGID